MQTHIAFRRLALLVPILVALLGLLGIRHAVAKTLSAPSGGTITVNSYLDVLANDSTCTLREAILAANTDTASGMAFGECLAGSGADIILMPGGLYTLTLMGSGPTGGDLDITSQLKISTSDGSIAKIFADITADRVIEISTTGRATLSSLWIYGGEDNGFGGGGISNSGELTLTYSLVYGNYTSAGGGGLQNKTGAKANLANVGFGSNNGSSGGCIWNTGFLTLSQVSLSFCEANNGAGLYNLNPGMAHFQNSNVSASTAITNGGGILNFSVLTLTQTTINGNEATGGDGGGIYNEGTVNLENVTISDNSADLGMGGGFFRKSGGGLLTNVTIVDNSAGLGGGIRAVVSGLSVRNVLLANNSGGNCRVDTGTLTSLGNNLSSDNTCNLGLNQPSDQNNTGDPLLGPLQNNGGHTETHALLPGSPAIDHGGNTGCPNIDQRGFLRPADGDENGSVVCDIGAFEVVPLTFLPLIRR